MLFSLTYLPVKLDIWQPHSINLLISRLNEEQHWKVIFTASIDMVATLLTKSCSNIIWYAVDRVVSFFKLEGPVQPQPFVNNGLIGLGPKYLGAWVKLNTTRLNDTFNSFNDRFAYTNYFLERI